MPYNTRRKSLSLPSLGIQLPGGPRSARSPPSTSDGQQHVAKKQKRSHSGSLSSALPSPSRPAALRFDEHRPKSSGRVADTPPPSPGADSGSTKVDTQGIDDEIVVGVIEQLQKTGNRPHLLKELALVLSPIIPIVERYVPKTSSCNAWSVLHMLTCLQLRKPSCHYLITLGYVSQAQLDSPIKMSPRQEACWHPPKARLLLPLHLPAPADSCRWG